MPIYEYRCACGEVVEALVRGGREPKHGEEAGHFCDSSGELKRMLSAPFVGSSSSKGGGFEAASASSPPAGEGNCGHCGRVPGSCAYD
jgi:predicted nucleic acid-binding Zn ribbon protein